MHCSLRLFSVLWAMAPAFAQSPQPKAPPAPAPAQNPLEHLVGKWVLKGEIAGKATTHDVEATWVLNRGYVQIHEVSREQDAEGRPQYEAILYVTRDAASGEVSILWLDNTGSGHFSMDGVGKAKPEQGSLPFVFRDEHGEINFTNDFVWDAKAGSWQWIMDNVDKGVHKPFGRVTLTRK
jgi:hypothetical protein